MTGKLAGNITAIFTGAEVTETSSSLTNNQITIPNDINDKPYTTVEFKMVILLLENIIYLMKTAVVLHR